MERLRTDVAFGFDAVVSSLNTNVSATLQLARVTPAARNVRFGADALSRPQLRGLLDARGLEAHTAPGRSLDGITGSHLRLLTGAGGGGGARGEGRAAGRPRASAAGAHGRAGELHG